MREKFNLKSFLIMNFGVFIISIGLYFFIIPSNLTVGGVTGFSILINSLFPLLPIGTIMMVTNIFLFILAFIVIGKEFGGFTIYNSLAVAFLITIYEGLIHIDGPIVDDLIINLLYGILIQAIGLAVVFNQNSSTGGTDILAKIINKYTNIDMGKSLFFVDSLIVLGGTLLFGLELGLYAFLGAIINSTVVDKVMAGFKTRIKVAIISDKEREITKYITEELVRGVTLYHGASGYSNVEKRIINTVVTRKEYIIIKNKVKEIDENAFVWVSFVNEVLGQGFQGL